MQYKTRTINVLLAIALGSGLVIGAGVLAQSRSQGTSLRNPLPRDVVQKFQAQARRSQSEEKKARLLLDQRRFAEAKAACDRALALSPKINGLPIRTQVVQLRGDIYLEEGRYKDAITTYNTARKHTRNVELDLNTALAYVGLGDLAHAHKFYSEDKFFNRGDSPKQKAKYFPQLPGTRSAKAFKASLYFARGCEKSSYVALDEAVKDYRKALNLYPHNGMFAYHAAKQLARLKRYEQALPLWELAAKFAGGELARDAKVHIDTWYSYQRQKAK